MAPIKVIYVEILTGDVDGAGTDGDVYLGICGREFYIDSSADDFERDSKGTYKLGEGATILNAEANDPRNPQLDSNNLDKFPVYIRFDPSGSRPDWYLRSVNVELAGTGYGVIFKQGLWLGSRSGKFCYLVQGRFGE